MEVEFFTSSGVLRYGENRLVLDIDQGIVDYYRSMIPKYMDIRPQRYNAHISVVRKEIKEPNRNFWFKHENKEIDFVYSPKICFDNRYYWLNVWSKGLETIRTELELSNIPHYIGDGYTPPPLNTDFIKTFHVTIGNRKK